MAPSAREEKNQDRPLTSFSSAVTPSQSSLMLALSESQQGLAVVQVLCNRTHRRQRPPLALGPGDHTWRSRPDINMSLPCWLMVLEGICW